MKKNCFTVAEVLITLGIIGVVAVLTIPNLVHKFQRRVWHTQFINTTAKIRQAVQITCRHYDDMSPLIQADHSAV